jgi:hypothetical protein
MLTCYITSQGGKHYRIADSSTGYDYIQNVPVVGIPHLAGEVTLSHGLAWVVHVSCFGIGSTDSLVAIMVSACLESLGMV